jgi:AraC-like DNA-binding protein
MEKLGAAVKLVELKKSIDDKKAEISTKKSEITQKESSIDTLIKEIITKKRQDLANYNISKGFEKTTSEDNRRAETELLNIKRLLQEIRYLENDGNADLPSSNSDENTALTKITQILDEIGYKGKAYLVDYLIKVLANKEDGNKDINQAIQRIKDGK